MPAALGKHLRYNRTDAAIEGTAHAVHLDDCKVGLLAILGAEQQPMQRLAIRGVEPTELRPKRHTRLLPEGVYLSRGFA